MVLSRASRSLNRRFWLRNSRLAIPKSEPTWPRDSTSPRPRLDSIGPRLGITGSSHHQLARSRDNRSGLDRRETEPLGVRGPWWLRLSLLDDAALVPVRESLIFRT